MEKAKETANRLIVEAEQMKVKLDTSPQGIPQIEYPSNIDDEFFHITCHIDQGLRSKIEQGQFVELEKLLVKDRPFMKQGANNRMGLFTREGVTFFARVQDRDVKITNIRCWEQAFRVYVAIYSKANPS